MTGLDGHPLRFLKVLQGSGAFRQTWAVLIVWAALMVLATFMFLEALTIC